MKATHHLPKASVAPVLVCLALAGGATSSQAVEYVTNGTFGAGTASWHSNSGGFSVTSGVATMDTSGGVTEGDLYQIVPESSYFVPGMTYQLTFDAKGAGTVSLYDLNYNLCLGAICASSQSFSNASWTSYKYTFDVPVTALDQYYTHLDFQVFSTNVHDVATLQLDNVSITSAVPEPGSYAMLLAGLGVMGVVGRRRMKRQA